MSETYLLTHLSLTKKSIFLTIYPSTHFPNNESATPITDTNNHVYSGNRPAHREGLRRRLQKLKSETVTPQCTSTSSDSIQSSVYKTETKKKKDAFFSSMLSNSNSKTHISKSKDIFEVLSTVETNNFIFNP